MLSPDDLTRTTGALEQEPRSPLAWRIQVSERRQSILQQKQTDALPALTISTTDSPAAKPVWRQGVLLREENLRLRFEIEAVKAEMQRLIGEYTKLQADFDREADTIHSGHRQEIEHYQQHLREMMDERNRLTETNMQVEQRYQELEQAFQAAVQEEARKIAATTRPTIDLSPTTPLPSMLDEEVPNLRLRQVEDDHLVEALYLKREVERMAEQLQQERRHLNVERTNFLTMQGRAREQLQTQQRVIKERYRAQWTGAIILTTTVMILALVVFQLATMAFFHLKFSVPLVFAMILPIVICTLVAAALAKPLALAKDMQASVPRRVKK